MLSGGADGGEKEQPRGDTVEVRFRGSKGDQGRKVAALMGMEGNGDKGTEEVKLLQELYQIHVGGWTFL